MVQAIFGAIGVSIAFGVAVIGYFQWRTAHQRIILDLFERRFEPYEQISKAIYDYGHKTKVSQETLDLFRKAQQRARFLYGEKVTTYLGDRCEDLLTVQLLRPLLDTSEQQHPPLTLEQQQKLAEADKQLTKLPIELPVLLIPYMRLDQKMPSFWWPC
jgi:hypothetical protein